MKSTFIYLTLLFYTTLLNAQTWVRQNPFSTLSQMYDVDFDGKYGLAVGADRTMFRTVNGGITWDRQTPSPLARDIESAKVVPGTMGQVMIAGGDSILMVTHNGGALWKTSYVEIPNVYKIQVLPGNVFLALGKDFGVYSVDNGLTWQPFNMPAFGVTAGHFVSIHEGWVALGEPDNVQIWHTDDGGFSWERRDLQLFDLVNGIEMINDTVGFLASRNYVFKTYDGGQLWWPLHTVPTDYIRDLFVIDEDHLWTSLDDGSIYFSNSGGSTWEEKPQDVLNSNRALGIWANRAGKIWTVGKYMTILYSADFGQSWTDQLPAEKQTLFAPDFYNAFVGIVGGEDGTIMKTINGGGTWETIHFPRTESFNATAMVDNNTFIIGSYSGNVFITGDGGESWRQIGENLGQVTDVYAFNDHEFIITNKGGDIYKTTNSGETWTRTYNGPHDLLGMFFYNNSLGWATGANGRILATTDGGNTWTMQHDDFDREFSDIFFTSNLNGWVTSSNFSDSIWYTKDGGITWESILLPYKTYWQGVTFMNNDTGWIAGGSDGIGIILRTNDGGQTWFLDHSSPDAFMGVYSIPNSETIWAVGFGGNIMKFSSCASPPKLTQLRGNQEPCVGDTIVYIVEFDDVDVFQWTLPEDWHVIGNMSSAAIYFIASENPGIISVEGSDACGDTTVRLSAEIFPVAIPDVKISEENGLLVSNVLSGNYQWFLNGVLIPGAHDHFYKPTVNGTYQMIYTTFASGCEGSSNIFRYGLIPTDFTDIDEITPAPNPANNRFTIHHTDGSYIEPGAKVILTHIDGRVIHTVVSDGSEVALPKIPDGLYSIQVLTERKLLAGKILVQQF
jgi:photosystem II stability/assembly factor-like uncharacterized protein